MNSNTKRPITSMRCSQGSIGFLIMLVAACGEAPVGDAITILDSAGVRIVVNSQVDQRLDWAVTRVRTIGGQADDATPFSGVGNRLASDGAGNVYLLDRDGAHVLRFTPDGALDRLYGRRGGGPGELERPDTLLVSGDTVLLVLDNAKRAFVRYRLDGTVLDNMPLEHYTGNGPAALLAGRPIHPRVTRGHSGESRHELLLYGDNGAPSIVGERPLPNGTTVTVPRCRLTLGSLRPFLAPYLQWHARDTTLIVHGQDDYSLDVLGPSGLRARIRRPIGAMEVTAELALSAAEREFGADGFTVTTPVSRCTLTPVEMVELRGFTSRISPVAGLNISPDGAVWISRITTSGAIVIDVVSPDGAYSGTLPAGTPFPVTFLTPSKFARVEHSELGAEMLVIYEIRR